jgi:hypothetical protein
LTRLPTTKALTRFCAGSHADGDLRFPAWGSSEMATRPHRASARFGGGPTTRCKRRPCRFNKLFAEVEARFLSTAELELKEAMEFYEAARRGLGAEFLDEIEATVVSSKNSLWRGRPCLLELVDTEPPAFPSVFSIKSGLTRS